MDNLKKLLGKVEEMQKQRDTLEKQFRDQVHNDDITTSLVVQEGDREVTNFFCLTLSFLKWIVKLEPLSPSAQKNTTERNTLASTHLLSLVLDLYPVAR